MKINLFIVFGWVALLLAAHGLDKLKNSKALDELGKSLRASYESRGIIPKGLSGKEVGGNT